MLAFVFSLFSILFCLFAVYWCWWKWFLYDGSYTGGEPHVDCLNCGEPFPVPSGKPHESIGQCCKVCHFKFEEIDWYNPLYLLHIYHYGHFWKPWTWREVRAKRYINKSSYSLYGVESRDVSNG